MLSSFAREIEEFQKRGGKIKVLPPEPNHPRSTLLVDDHHWTPFGYEPWEPWEGGEKDG